MLDQTTIEVRITQPEDSKKAITGNDYLEGIYTYTPVQGGIAFEYYPRPEFWVNLKTAADSELTYDLGKLLNVPESYKG